MNLEDDWFGNHHTGTRGKGLAQHLQDKCCEVGGNSSPSSSSSSPLQCCCVEVLQPGQGHPEGEEGLSDRLDLWDAHVYERQQTSLFGVNGRY